MAQGRTEVILQSVGLKAEQGTIHAQVHAHDESINRMGYCVECRRLKGSHEMAKASG